MGSKFTPGTRVRVQMNGVPTTYDGVVIEPSSDERAWVRDPNRYVWIRRDDGTVVPWQPASLTVLRPVVQSTTEEPQT